MNLKKDLSSAETRQKHFTCPEEMIGRQSDVSFMKTTIFYLLCRYT